MKCILKLLATIILIWWLILSHVSFMSEDNLSFVHKEEYSDYVAKWYMTKSINPIGFWFNITDEGTTSFAVLLDKEGNYIGQTSPFYLSAWVGANTSSLPTGKYNAFSSVGGIEIEDAYSISVSDRKWWDYVLKYFYEVQNGY